MNKGVVSLVVVAGLALVCGAGMCAYRRDKAKYEGLEAACEGRPVPGAATYTGVGAPRLLAYTRGAAGGWVWGLSLTPREMRAESRSDASLVVCAERPRTVNTGACEFTSTGGPGIGVRVFGVRVATIGRSAGTTVYPETQQELPVRVVEAATGRVRAEGVIRGPAGRDCNGAFPSTPSRGDFQGASVGSTELAAWLTQNLGAH